MKLFDVIGKSVSRYCDMHYLFSLTGNIFSKMKT